MAELVGPLVESSGGAHLAAQLPGRPTLLGCGVVGEVAESSGARVGEPQQEGQDDVVGQQRGSAVADEGQGDAGQRDELDDATDDDERLEPHDRGEAGGEQLLEGVLGAQRDAQPAADEQQVRGEHRRATEQPELLADRREDEVVLGLGHLVGGAPAQPGAEHPAVAEAVDRLDDLVAAVERARPRIDPDVDPGLDVIERPPGHDRCAGEQDHAHHQVAGALGGDPHHHDEQREEQQRGAEVALADHHDHREAPGQQDRGQVARLGEAQRPDPPGAGRDELSPFGQVGGEEDGERDLGELARLEVDRPDAHPDAGAAELLADAGDEGEQQHGGAGGEQGPGEAGEVGRSLDEEQHGHERSDRDEAPDGLEAGEPVVEPGDHHVAEAVEEGGDRQQDGVGAAGEQANGDVGDHDEAEDHAQERHDAGGDDGVGAEGGRDVGGAGEQPGHDDQGQLGVASAPGDR